MPLIKYSQYLTFPGGSPAADVAVPVQLMGGNVLVPTFSDKAGQLPIDNPVLTDSDGLAVFYAAPGAYFTDLAGAIHYYVVDATEMDEAWPGTYIHPQATAASVWTVEHHFGVPPAVTVLLDGQVSQADVTHPDSETTVITFGAPASGTALLRR